VAEKGGGEDVRIRGKRAMVVGEIDAPENRHLRKTELVESGNSYTVSSKNSLTITNRHVTVNCGEPVLLQKKVFVLND